MMKKLLSLLVGLSFIGTVHATTIEQFPPGFRLTDGTHLNQLVDAVNNLTGGGTAAPVVGTTGTFSGNVTLTAGNLIMGATTFTEATLSLYAKGVAAGYKIARGATTLDGTNPTPVATGLATVVACNVSLATSVAPGVSTMLVTGVITTATLNVYGWKPTDATNNTLVASSGTDEVQWHCVGT